ncbi:MAG: aspartate aminotransferase family protein [Xanthomonadales bacterium]
MSDHLMTTYAPAALAFERGEGAWLWDEDGRRYLDAVAGIAVCSLGHAHPALARVIADQATRLIHTANLVRIPWQERLADRLVDITGMERVFVANSGAEAIECAIKINRMLGHARGIDLPSIVVMESSFHGRTLAALSASGSRKVQAGFEPLIGGFVRVPFDDLDAVRAAVRGNPDVTAVLVEPIQGEGGVRLPSPTYLAGLRRICDEHDCLLMLDEIQTGLCRTGRWYAHQHDAILPDVLTTAKALGNGVPIGACVARGAAAAAFKPGSHGSTFGGNPLACRTACSVLDIMREEEIAARAARLGAAMLENFRARLGDDPRVRDVRGRGLMIGVELDRPAAPVGQRALEQGLLINVTRDSVIRLVPPLIIDDAQADEIVDTVCRSIEALD